MKKVILVIFFMIFAILSEDLISNLSARPGGGSSYRGSSGGGFRSSSGGSSFNSSGSGGGSMDLGTGLLIVFIVLSVINYATFTYGIDFQDKTIDLKMRLMVIGGFVLGAILASLCVMNSPQTLFLLGFVVLISPIVFLYLGIKAIFGKKKSVYVASSSEGKK